MRRHAAFGLGTFVGILLVLAISGQVALDYLLAPALTGYVIADAVTTIPNETVTAVAPRIIERNATEEEARQALSWAEQDIEVMARAGIGVYYVNDLYAEAKAAFDGENVTKLRERAKLLQESDPELAASLLRMLATGKEKVGENYTLVVQKTDLIRKTKDESLTLLDELDTLELEVADFLNTTTGVNTTDVTDSYDAARREFSQERYAAVAPLINETYVRMEDARAESSRVNAMLKASRRTIPYFIKTYVRELLLAAAILTVLGLIVYNEARRLLLAHRLRDLDVERTVAQEMMRRAQTEYYVTKKISSSMFTTKMDKYREKLLDLKEKRPLAEAALAKTVERRKYYLLGLRRKKQSMQS